ncbi:MAG: hypothetical protein ACYTBS_27450, partial [Planctomycetota bacterium]
MRRKKSTTVTILLASLFVFIASGVFAREKSASPSSLPVKWGELTAPDFVKAVKKSGGVCLIPIGV